MPASHYQAPKQAIWQGRNDGPNAGRIFQSIRCEELAQAQSQSQAIALLGFACEAGVIRNQGRPGAKQGPAALRHALTNLPWEKSTLWYDFGDIVCDDEDLEAAQTALAHAVSTLQAKGYHTIVLGGGHEIAWGHYQGLAPHYPKLQIINIDAHLDLRPLLAGDRGSSGTPFLQIANHRRDFHYACLGVQTSANTQNLFATAEQLNTCTILAEHCQDPKQVISKLKSFLDPTYPVYLTLCLDVLASAHAPGVSAPQAMGLLPGQVQAILKAIYQHSEVISFDVAELSPPHDCNHQTAKLGAYFILQHATSIITD